MEFAIMAGLIGLAIAFFVLALIAGALGMSGVAGISMNIAKWLVIVFVIFAPIKLAFISFIP
jgi:uncharacterized membrane protein YtjA (UPF0391 family)